MKNSKSFVQKVKLDIIPWNYKIVSFDVKSPFTNVPLDQTVSIIHKGCVCYIFAGLFCKSKSEHS